ncbi:hypothetical protein pb186bvf_000167 [Paramecium bursaria]
MAAREEGSAGMVNDQGKVVDLYVPRRCDYTNKILDSKDISSVQINVGLVDQQGRYTGQNTTVVLSGYLRSKGKSAGALEAVLKQRKLFPY